MNRSLTAVDGIRVGHAVVDGGRSGCTVIRGPFRAAVEVRGMATGSRELGVLEPTHLVPEIDAILLTGGSAYGLAAADGVMEAAAAEGVGFRTPAALVPIVPAAVIYDLTGGGRRPGAGQGRAAWAVATDEPVAEGRVGAGAGATVGKVDGPGRASPGGLGSWAVHADDWTVGALAVVNAFGEVVGFDGRIVAGARARSSGFVSTADFMAGLDGPPTPPPDPDDPLAGFVGSATPSHPGAAVPGTNTTLAVVAVSQPLSRVDLARVARMAANALARRIHPVHTPYDGDVVFAVAPDPMASGPVEEGRAHVLSLGMAAQEALEVAIVRAVQPDGGRTETGPHRPQPTIRY